MYHTLELQCLKLDEVFKILLLLFPFPIPECLPLNVSVYQVESNEQMNAITLDLVKGSIQVD